MKHIVVGCGGVGCWLVPLLQKMSKKEDIITVMDGDVIDPRNYDRQFHQPEHVGWNKAEALYYQYNLGAFYPRYLTRFTRPALPVIGMVWSCVDNHPARRECLDWIDESKAFGIFGGNEYESSQAYLYSSAWKGTKLDPRVRYPEILTDNSGDPNHPNCTGLAQEADPQLALFNCLAAAQMMQLYYFWLNYGLNVPESLWPVEQIASFTCCQTFNVITINNHELFRSVPESRGEIQNIQTAD